MPEEFAAAYRAAYEQAMAAQSVPLRQGEHAEVEDDEIGLPRRTRPLRIGTHRLSERRRVPPVPAPAAEPSPADDDEGASAYERARVSGWLAPTLLAVLALLLVVSAYVVGRAFAGHVAQRGGSGDAPRVVMSEGGSSQQKQPVLQQKAADGAWTGKVVPISGVRASTGCTSDPGVDAGGTRVSYNAANLTDGVADTTWRCDGSAIGQRLTLDLGRKREVAEVGLIPGYAKTDDADGTDRYAEDNRVTKVRWTIGSTVVEQSMSGDPQDRRVRLMRVPKSAARTVTLQILGGGQGRSRPDGDQRGAARCCVLSLTSPGSA